MPLDPRNREIRLIQAMHVRSRRALKRIDEALARGGNSGELSLAKLLRVLEDYVFTAAFSAAAVTKLVECEALTEAFEALADYYEGRADQ